MDSRPYGNNSKIEKLECVNHVFKRIGTRQELRQDKKKVKLSDGKKLSGKNRLSDKVIITKLQGYNGRALKENTDDIEKMRKAIWAIFHH